MIAIILDQLLHRTRIINLYANFKKVGDRMNVSSFKSQLEQLRKIWTEFETIHITLFNNLDFQTL